ncbi:MAG: hypothetical protein WBX81_14215 [Nitrososphaeraceae archaeon]
MTRLKFAEVRPHPVKIQGLKTLIHRILKRSEVKSADVMRSHGFEYLKRKSEEYDTGMWEVMGNFKEVRQ